MLRNLTKRVAQRRHSINRRFQSAEVTVVTHTLQSPAGTIQHLWQSAVPAGLIDELTLSIP